MATNIYNFDGTLLTTIPDGSIDTTSASIKFPGRGYVNYGAPVNENMLWIMQHFASPDAPSLPINGQAWYDTNEKILKVYDATSSTWISAGGAIRSGTAPVSANVGALWYDTTKNQLHVWNGASWLLVGPLAASDGLDPLDPSAPGYSRIEAIRVSDGATTHRVWKISVGATPVALISADAAFAPAAGNPLLSAFPTIYPGITVSNSLSGGGGFFGDTGVFRANQTNLPAANNTYNLGSSSAAFANVFATLFNGTATAARYADLAERYASDVPYDPGTVVKLGGAAEVTCTTTAGDTDVFGVVSTNPAHLMNSDAGTDQSHPAIALVGRVPCKVTGKISKGQRLMSSEIPGTACAWDQQFGTTAILGRALEDKNASGPGTIEIVVGKN